MTNDRNGILAGACGVILLLGAACIAESAKHGSGAAAPAAAPASHTHSVAATARGTPVPLPSHPGNVFLVGEEVTAPIPESVAATARTWKVVDEQQRLVTTGNCSTGAGAASGIALGKLSVGWYRVEFQSASGEPVGWTSAAVLVPLVVPTPQDSPVCVDIASAWFARAYGATQKQHQEYYASLAAMAGANWVRDRMNWGELEPTQGAWAGETNYDTSAAAQAAQGLNVLQVFHSTPKWAIDAKLDGTEAWKRFPRDLRHEYRFCKAMAERFKGRVLAWEPWNEANITGFGGHTATEMSALQKAAYLGFKAGDPDLTVCWNVFAGAGSPAHTRSILANEAWPYFDTYNIHAYDPPANYLRLFATARDAACGRPLWLTECGIHVPWKTERPWGDMTPEDEVKQARFVTKSYASSLFAGVNRHFFFILGNYLENQTQFGLMRYDHTPRPGYVAFATVGRLLAGAQCLGRIVPNGDDSTSVYAFTAMPAGVAKVVLVAWSETNQPWPGGKPGRAEAVVDYLGRNAGAEPPSTLRPEAVFVILPFGAAKSLKLEPPATVSPRRDGTPSPVVLQLSEPNNAANLSAEAYTRNAGTTAAVELVAYNFADHPVAGTVSVETLPDGWRLEPATWRVDLEPMGRMPLAAQLTLAGTGRALLAGNTIKLRGDFGADGRPALAFNMAASLADVTPATTRAIAAAPKPDAWTDNINGGATMTHQPVAPNGMQFDMQFGTNDPWGYPTLTLDTDAIPTEDLDGLAFTIQIIEGAGTFRVQFIEENGASYITDIPFSADLRTPQRAVCLFSSAAWGAWSKPDPDGKLQPAQLRKVMVGLNAKTNTKVRYVVTGLEWVRF
ncbi:MAG: hypothetical protein A3K19_25800 [Lentisphaerae bacterium RIFOXYB12_FULL_65_16]|nr:MAG: hypothetical protein A3K18_31800 [Lentisphaerae bacterium RIFOXYA12_64_32]OGV88015.1 MAG: hypothetical protein A3K19_25800 [Lentisphaerae bacterium RIFOXYB12_FULL_65_16]